MVGVTLSASCLSFRFSLTEEGLALAEKLASAEQETKGGAKGDGEEVRSQGEELEEEEEVVVDLTESGEDEEKEDSNSLTKRAACVTQPMNDEGRMCSSANPQNSQATGKKLNGEHLLPGNYEIILCVDFIETTG